MSTSWGLPYNLCHHSSSSPLMESIMLGSERNCQDSSSTTLDLCISPQLLWGAWWRPALNQCSDKDSSVNRREMPFHLLMVTVPVAPSCTTFSKIVPRIWGERGRCSMWRLFRHHPLHWILRSLLFHLHCPSPSLCLLSFHLLPHCRLLPHQRLLPHLLLLLFQQLDSPLLVLERRQHFWPMTFFAISVGGHFILISEQMKLAHGRFRGRLLSCATCNNGEKGNWSCTVTLRTPPQPGEHCSIFKKTRKRLQSSIEIMSIRLLACAVVSTLWLQGRGQRWILEIA